MNSTSILDKVRYIPVLHFATLWWFAVDSLRYPGKINRAIRMLLTAIGCTLLSGIICFTLTWLPEWAVVACMFCCLYGVVVCTITSVRKEILQLSDK